MSEFNLPAEFENMFDRVINSDSDDFFELSVITGLNPLKDFAGANLSGVDLSNKDLQSANFQRTNFWRANLSGANLHGANLREANLSEANLNGANLSEVDLSYANLCAANFSDTNMSQCSLDSVVGISDKEKLDLINKSKKTRNAFSLQLMSKDFTIDKPTFESSPWVQPKEDIQAESEAIPKKPDSIRAIKKMLEFLSGADPQILKRPECRHDRIIYQSIGLSVALTGLFACISFGYASYTIFKVISISIPLGLFWGLAIVMIDRFLIITISKQNTFSWNHVITTASRILMAAMIAIAISKPLEIAIFSKEIRATISESNEVQMQQAVAKSSVSLGMEQLRQENKVLHTQNEQFRVDHKKAYENLLREAEGSSGTSQVGIGPVFALKAQELKRIEELINSTTTQIQSNKERIQTLEKERTAKIKQIESTRLSADSFLAQLQALQLMNQKNPVIAWCSYLISAIFILLSISPILGKLLTKSTAYDYCKQHILRNDLLSAELENELEKQSLLLFDKQRKLKILERELLLEKEQDLLAKKKEDWLEFLGKTKYMDIEDNEKYIAQAKIRDQLLKALLHE
jgi:hypothetical protein